MKNRTPTEAEARGQRREISLCAQKASAEDSVAQSLNQSSQSASRNFSNYAGAKLFAAWRWWLPLACVAFALAVLFRDPFAGDWDALDYTVLALRPAPSPMLLGRALFIFTNAAAFKIAHALCGLPKEKAYLLFKWLVIFESPLVIIACWNFTRELVGSRRVATIAALLVALSPVYIFYSGQAMTEIPSLLLLFIALNVHLRGIKTGRTSLILLGAALLGLGVNVRELAAFYGAWLIIGLRNKKSLESGVWSLESKDRFKVQDSKFKVNSEQIEDQRPKTEDQTANGKSKIANSPSIRNPQSAIRNRKTLFLACFVFSVCAFAPFAVWFGFNLGGYRAWWLAWFAASKQEQALHPIALANLKQLFLFFFIAAPVVLLTLPFAFYTEWRRCGFSLVFMLGAIGLCANLALILHYSLTINPRYLLTGLPGLAPLTASFLQFVAVKIFGKRRGLTFALLIIAAISLALGVSLLPIARNAQAAHAMNGEYINRLRLLPKSAVVIAGAQTVAVGYWRALGCGDWEIIGAGAGFPSGHLKETIENYLHTGQRVFLDADPHLWSRRGWQGIETREVAQLSNQFHFRKISDTIYELRPLDDDTARDAPDLQKLLEN